MYDPHAVLAAIDVHAIEIIVLCGLVAMVPTFAWFVDAIRVGRRDQVCAMPPVCTLFWFAHDTSFVARYELWFEVYDHWYLKLFWVLLIGTVALEIVYIAQAIRYGRREWAPQLSPRAFGAISLLILAIAIVIWTVIKTTLNDPLYIVAFGLTVVVYPAAAIPMMLRRGSSKGQSSLMWFGYMGLATGYFAATTLYFGDAFRSWSWIGLGVISVFGGVAAWTLSNRLRDRPLSFDPGVTAPAIVA